MAMQELARFKRSASSVGLLSPVAKKGRESLESPSTNAPSSPSPTAMELVLFDEEAVASALAQPHGDDNGPAKACPCCQRIVNVDGSYWQDAKVEWMKSDHSGAWCKDGHQVWKLLHSNTMSLTMYASYLKDPVNRTQHVQMVGILLMLRVEGRTPTAKLLLERFDSFKFMCRFMGSPIHTSKVMSLQRYRRECEGQVPPPSLQDKAIKPLLKVDEGLAQKACGTGSADRLINMVKGFFPTAAAAKSVQQVLQNITALRKCSLFTAADAKAQSKIGNVAKVLAAMADKQKPNMTHISSDALARGPIS